MMSRGKQRVTIGWPRCPPGAVYSWARRCGRGYGEAHACSLCRGITSQFVIRLRGHEPFILSNPLFSHSDWVNMT